MNSLFDETPSLQFSLENFNEFCLSHLPNIYFMDTETSGLDGEVIEFSLISLDGWGIYHTRCKPLIQFIDNGATAVHGITLKDLKDKKTFYEYLEKIISWKIFDSGKSKHGKAIPIIMYNSDFDKRIIHNSFKLQNKFHKSTLITKDEDYFFNREFPCVMKILSEQNKKDGLGSKWLKLVNAASQFSIKTDLSKLHGSLYDTLLTRAIFVNLAMKIGNDEVKKHLKSSLGENFNNEILMTINESVLKSNTDILNKK
jgi:DNA polymerase III epsilon subunit-like protein